MPLCENPIIYYVFSTSKTLIFLKSNENLIIYYVLEPSEKSASPRARCDGARPLPQTPSPCSRYPFSTQRPPLHRHPPALRPGRILHAPLPEPLPLLTLPFQKYNVHRFKALPVIRRPLLEGPSGCEVELSSSGVSLWAPNRFQTCELSQTGLSQGQVRRSGQKVLSQGLSLEKHHNPAFLPEVSKTSFLKGHPLRNQLLATFP